MKNRLLLFLIRWYNLSDRPVPRWLQRACDRDVIISLELDGHEALTQELSQIRILQIGS
ncbi:MAG: hypothetical protein ACI92G_000316 [Candidatus Pelagisphaera sp.]|jgi:hypothetical protein